ncbi:hypothetical protein GPECTOR_110g238 [Gonium pectorale]|uniref:SAM domain-containing protein n=1 Tax=Gonium pectorale TaxID=33097 RepID=A0A150G0G3_GONPE|nr:hypothetical protein GPECTOR_110g238 [Gonium pectorale]|eukprot:KXZ42945.1 hypothetical protein GPECTOR_110g238 [Gonium pectorale]
MARLSEALYQAVDYAVDKLWTTRNKGGRDDYSSSGSVSQDEELYNSQEEVQSAKPSHRPSNAPSSRLASEPRSSHTHQSAAPSQRTTSASGYAPSGAGGHEASLAFSDVGSAKRSKAPSAAVRSARASGLSGLSGELTGDISLDTTPKAQSRQPSQPGAGAARSARQSAMSGLSQDLTGVTGDISLGGGSTLTPRSANKQPSRPATDAGASRSARPSGLSGMSGELGGATGEISYGDAGGGGASSEAASAPSQPVRRRSSLASSLRQSVKAASEAAEESADGESSVTVTAAGGGAADAAADSNSASYSEPVDDGTESQRSAVTPRKSASLRSGAPSSTTVRTARTAADPPAAQSSGGYSEGGFEEEEVEGGEDEAPQRAASTYSESVVEASESAAAPGSESVLEASESVASASLRHRSAPPARRPANAASESAGDGYSGEDFDAASASASRSHPAEESGSADPGASGGIAAGGEGGAAAGGAGGVSAAGSIFQQPPGSAVGAPPSGSGGSVFQRLPADAPDDASIRSGPSARDQGDAAAAPPPPAQEWNEGAIRVAPPGAHRSGMWRENSVMQRPMSAAPRDRQSAQLASLTRKHPATWDPVDVATWVEFLGLGQYRRRFLHHCIDGRMLVRLTDAQLKAELGIGPMGHRVAILDAAATVVKSYNEAQRDRPDADDGAAGPAPGAEPSRQEYRPPAARAGSAPRPRARPASAMPGGTGALSASPPRVPSGPRRPASASRSLMPPDAYLGPAKGKQTVYEQRAKLLFELDRAQARAEQHRALADQLKHTANLSSEEAAHLRGLLADIEKKNRQAFGLSGGVDGSARIPWHHIGKGTKHNNWNPERFAKPGEPETVDLTFKPACPSAESKRLLSNGGGGGGGGGEGEATNPVNSFLDRLNNDLRKREQTKKELERRYYSDGSADGRTEADWNAVASQLASRCRISLDRDPNVYDGQIDEALDHLSSSESWREAGLKTEPIRKAKGPAKLSAAASALRSLAFMERYRSDLKTRSTKITSLEKKWISRTLGDKYLPAARDQEDLAQAVQFFALLGWREDDGSPSEQAVAPYLLDRLLERAVEYRRHFDAWWERVRERPQERAAGYQPNINWNAPPWDTDGLTAPMLEEMERMAASAEEAATTTSPGGTLTRGTVEVGPLLPAGGMDFVEFTVRLLGKCRLDDLHRLQQLGPKQKRLGVYRAIRTQKFIEFTERDLEERDRKLRQAYSTLAPSRRRIPSSRIEGFFERLHEDAARRRARAEALAHEKVSKEKEILASSVMYGRPRSAR